MITTRIENRLRHRFYGLFWKRFNPLATEVWKVKLTQCIEQNVQFNGMRYSMPDRYLVTLEPGMLVTDEEKQIFARKIKDFISDYANESGYKIMNDVRIDFITKETKYSTGVTFFGWVSNIHESVGNIDAIVYNIERKDEIIKFISLSVQNKYLIGRADTAKIMLNHHHISHNHAQLIVDEFCTVYVRDLRSLNGTYLQGKRLEPHKLYPLKLPSTMCIGGIYEIVIRSKSGRTMNNAKCKVQNKNWIFRKFV